MKLPQLVFPLLVLAVSGAKAQVQFSAGPKVGLNVSTAQFSDYVPRFNTPGYTYRQTTSYRAGLEAGVEGLVKRGRLGLQLAVLYSQKGYQSQFITNGPYYPSTQYNDNNVRLDYVTLPLNLVFFPHLSGKELHLFAGPYLSTLVGGRNHLAYSTSIAPTPLQLEQGIEAGNAPATTHAFHSQRLDAGMQAGLGFFIGQLLIQASYSLGLRNLAVDYSQLNGSTITGTPYYNHALQLSTAYLFKLNN